MKMKNRRRKPYTKLKAFLVEHEIQQSDLAKIIGKSSSSLNQKINGTGSDFTIEEIRLICSKYGISADEFFLHFGFRMRSQGRYEI
jgi:transcriptional regulator with XRE-family HTH domain